MKDAEVMARQITQQQFAKLVSEGFTMQDVAIRFDITMQTLRNWERRFGLKCRRRQRPSLIDEGTLRKLVAHGLKSIQIAENLHVSRMAVYYYLKKYGIEYQSQCHQALKFPQVAFDNFARDVRDKFSDATVEVKGKLVMFDGELIGEEGERWFEEKVRTAFPRRGQFSF